MQTALRTTGSLRLKLLKRLQLLWMLMFPRTPLPVHSCLFCYSAYAQPSKGTSKVWCVRLGGQQEGA